MKRRVFLVGLVLICFVLVGCSNLIDNLLPKPDKDFVDFEPTPKISYDHLFDGVDFKSGEVLVRLNGSGDELGILQNLGAHILESYRGLGWVLASVPVGQTTKGFIKELESLDQVIMAAPNRKYMIPKKDFGQRNLPGASNLPDAEDYKKLWGIRSINADKAWQVTTGSSEVIVALLTGTLDLTHPEFSDLQVIQPYDSTNDGVIIDFIGEGTGMAGIIASNGRSGKLAGVVWDCPLMPIKIIEDNGMVADSYIAKGIVSVVDFLLENPQYRAVMVTEIYNWGYSNIIKDAVDYAFENGVLLVAPSGDDSKASIFYPAAYNGVVSVSSSNPFDKKVDKASASYWNSLAAPGIDIWTTRPDSNYEMLYGTPLAASYVGGAVAMLLSENPHLSPLEILNQLEETARPGYYGEGFNEKLGYGILDCQALLAGMKPMKYATLKVRTDAYYDREKDYYDYGMVTVYDENGRLVYFGATGADGSHNFYALLPGTYTVTLSYQGEIHDQVKFTIVRGEERIIQLQLKK